MPTLAEKLVQAMQLVTDCDNYLHDGASEIHRKMTAISKEERQHIFILILIIALLDLEDYFFMQYDLLQEIKDEITRGNELHIP